jgi:hypothetical protein
MSERNDAMNHSTPPASTGWAPGRPDSTPIVQVVAQSPIRAPLAGGIPWANHADHPAVAGFAFTTDAQIQTVPAAVVDRTGGKLDRR